MARLATLALAFVLLGSSVGCYHSRWAGYGGGGADGCGCRAAPGGGVFGGAPAGGGYMAPQQGAFYTPTGSSVNLAGPTAYGSPVYSAPYSATAMAPMDPLPTY